jgi:hypothetical protein
VGDVLAGGHVVSHSFDHWADTDDAFMASTKWGHHNDIPHAVSNDELLARFLATPDAADAYARWQADLIADHADRQQEERRDRRLPTSRPTT